MTNFVSNLKTFFKIIAIATLIALSVFFLEGLALWLALDGEFNNAGTFIAGAMSSVIPAVVWAKSYKALSKQVDFRALERGFLIISVSLLIVGSIIVYLLN